jgi:hypothetical protein
MPQSAKASKNGTQPQETEKKQIGVRLSPDALRLRASIGQKLGIDGTAVIELAIRALAQREGVE